MVKIQPGFKYFYHYSFKALYYTNIEHFISQGNNFMIYIYICIYNSNQGKN